MEIKEIFKRVDLTLLSIMSSEKQIAELCEKAVELEAASVCVPPCYVSLVKELYGEGLKVCTVVGFPNGYSTTEAKCAEAAEAIRNGADEVDMVINLCYLKDKKYGLILDEIRRVKSVCGDIILKVIIETCLLTEEEKIVMCGLVSDSGADYIKTSTGFSKAGATSDDIRLMRKHCAPHIRIKASGGIRSIYKAEVMLLSGADRIGTSGLKDE